MRATLKKVYRQPLQFVAALVPEYLVAFGLFCGGLVIGLIWPEHFNFLQAAVERLAERFRDLGPLAFIVGILTNNLVATYLVSCVIVLFGFAPAFSAGANGLLVGWVLAVTPGLGFFEAAAGLLPHGVFEIPAVTIAWGVGMWRGIGYRFAARFSGGAWQRWRMANRVYFLVVVPLLLVAAVIEGRLHIARALFA